MKLKSSAIKTVLLVLLVAVLWTVRYFTSLPSRLDPNFVGSYINQTLTLRAQVSDAPEQSSGTAQFPVEIQSVRVLSVWRPLHGIVVIHALLPGKISYGDVVEIKGQLQASTHDDPRIAGLVNNPTIKVTAHDQGSSVVAALLSLKSILLVRLNAVFPEPSASFAAGILIGARTQIPQDVIDDFKRSGLTHVIALSGFNIVILIVCIEKIFGRILTRRLSNIFSIIVVILFTIMVGLSASVVRAAIMGCLSLFARLLGRKTAGLRTLFITGAVMILLDPFVLIYDIGFQLSFGATAGIMFFANRWQKRLEKLPEKWGIKESLITTTAAQVFTTPVILYHFHTLALITPLSNIAVLPFIPWLMLGAALSLVFGKIVAGPTWLVCTFVLWLVHFFATLPFSFIDFGTW